MTRVTLRVMLVRPIHAYMLLFVKSNQAEIGAHVVFEKGAFCALPILSFYQLRRSEITGSQCDLVAKNEAFGTGMA